MTQPEKTLFVAAHPDDIEVMTGNLAMQPNIEAYALVATLGRQGQNRLGSRYLCRRW